MNFWFHTAGTSSALAGAGTFTSPAQPAAPYSALVIAVKTDVAGTMYVDFSPDGSNWDSTLDYAVAASTNEVHRLTVTRPFFRVRYVNGAAAQSYMRLTVMGDNYNLLASPLDSSIQQDADAIVARTFTEEFTISEGKAEGYSVVNKFGRNPDIDTGTVPEDVWNGGGVYAGFPTGSPEEFQVFSSSASDTGVLTITYLPTLDSTAYLQANVTLNGTTPVNSGITGIRMHSARYSSGASTTFNVGTITVRHITTTANIFCVMPIGRSQTNVAAYTVPAGSSGRIVRLFARAIGTTATIAEGALWIRSRNGSPRLRRPFTVAQNDNFEERPYAGLTVNAGDDIMVRINSVSANNTDIIAGYDLLLIKE